MRFTEAMRERARLALARIESELMPDGPGSPEARNAERDAAIRLLRRYGRSRAGLLGARPPQWRASDGIQPNGWRRSRWEDRLIFCLDIERAIFGLRSPRERYVLIQRFALDKVRMPVARELNLCLRTLSRIEDVALDHFVLKCRILGIEF
jgi:hypothetical protein